MNALTESDINSTLQEISLENPTGVNLRQNISPESPYYKAKELRANARKIERQYQEGDQTASSNAIWKQLEEICIEILKKESKDLGIGAWLVESLLRNSGFSGLKDGFFILRQLIDKYWDGLYPTVDEDGLSTKIASLVGLNGEDREGTLIAPILKIFITEGKSIGPFRLWQYQQALQIELLTDTKIRNQRLEKGGVSLADIERAVNETPPKFFIQLMNDAQGALDEFKALTNILVEKCGEEAPPSSTIKNTLEDSLSSIRAISSKIVEEYQRNSIEVAALSSESLKEDAPPNSHGPFHNREEALQTLLTIAAYFRRSEPQSPLPYILERTVKWGRMDLPQLLDELIEDDKAKGGIFRLTGIESSEKTKNG